ncbi:unnamed protein product [Enterobius vermicularis]|uniref:Uncharacterized protein n=1 Tax=Enterobius vermicularis TaxID=51028 RepID=A0A0N4VDD7_ENTVE|nr:unnamed protein product [Enterobius vermicularis]
MTRWSIVPKRAAGACGSSGPDAYWAVGSKISGKACIALVVGSAILCGRRTLCSWTAVKESLAIRENMTFSGSEIESAVASANPKFRTTKQHDAKIHSNLYTTVQLWARKHS